MKCPAGIFRESGERESVNWVLDTTGPLYVLLTVHLGSVLVNKQLDAQFFFRIYLFQFSTCFEHPRAHHQENQLYQYDIWYMSLCVGDRPLCRFGWHCSSIQTCTLDGHLHRVTYTRCIDTIDSPDYEHRGARNM